MKIGKLLFCILTSISLSQANAQSWQEMVCQGKVRALNSLLADTTDINLKDGRGWSLLHYSIACDQKSAFDYLIGKGIDINAEDNSGRSPLLLAIQRNKLALIDELIALNANANFNLANKEGTTVLMEAVLNDNVDIAHLLIKNGADLNLKNGRGNTALGIAKREGSQQMLTLLETSGASIEGMLLLDPRGEYMGAPKPNLIPQIFAPAYVSTENFVHNGVFHPNGKEFYFTIETSRYNWGTIMVSKMNEGKWSKPMPADIPGEFREVGPFITADGKKLYYASSKPTNEEDTINHNMNLWVMERSDERWVNPTYLGDQVNTDGNDWFPTISDKGTLYCYTHKNGSGNIYYSEISNGTFQEGVLIEGVNNGEYYNYDPFIAPDESYLIFASSKRPDGLGGADLYISFKNESNEWTPPKNMGKDINTSESEYAPILSADGEWLFFTRGYGDIYWISSAIIQQLK